MIIIEHTPGETEQLYCPSTKEVILSQLNEIINEDTQALIGLWHNECAEDPIIKDDGLRAEWAKFLEQKGENYFLSWDDCLLFLTNYNNDSYKAFDCDFREIACGPVYYSVIFVVKKDTEFMNEPC